MDKTLKKIYEDYQRRELDEVNEKVTDVLMTKLSELMVNLDLVKDNVSLEEDLAKNELFKSDVKRIIGYLTPYVPMVGLISGGITVGVHVANKKLNDHHVHVHVDGLIFQGQYFPRGIRLNPK